MLEKQKWKVCLSLCIFTFTQQVISSESFYKTYTLSHYSFDDEEQPSGHLEVWQNPEEWFCYWNDDKNDDESDLYVFADPPKRWKCGIVHLAEYKLESDKELRYKDFFRAVAILMKIQKAADELQLDCGKPFILYLCGTEILYMREMV